VRKALSFVVNVALLLAAAQTTRAVVNTKEFSVQLSAAVQENPPQITLIWPQDSCATPDTYIVYRKLPQATSWGKGTTLPGKSTAYVDKDVTTGRAYEYQVVKKASQYTGYGYLCAGIHAPLTENRGRLLLVVDQTYAADLARELARLQLDLAGDGWTVTRLNVGRNDSVANVKKLIHTQYQADPANVKAVFLFGHVPVPYSGDIVPDGHAPDHQGAWPCDGFYGDMDGAWTDNAVKNTGAADARTRNVPGDGKYDQSTFPAPLKLMVGRVDLANMPGRQKWGGPPTFPSELELLRNYLNKDHKFRHKEFELPRRAIVGDYFGVRDGEAFAASGWRNLSTFFNATNVTTLQDKGTWIATLSTNACLWAYGCGPGSYTSIGGLGNTDKFDDGVTTEMVRNDVKAVFTLLFGSWLGDWDSEDNMQRSVLALPSYGLTCALSGRPHWFMHHMALGEPIGYSTRLTQNNGPSGLYQNQMNSCAGQIHIALMGDPTLRMHTVAPPTALHGTKTDAGMKLNWNASSEPVVGYHVYRGANADGPFTRLTPSLVVGTSYLDASGGDRADALRTGKPYTTGDRRSGTDAPYHYMVRAVKLEMSASGTYYNPSQGAFLEPVAPASIAANPAPAAAGIELSIERSTQSEPQSPSTIKAQPSTEQPGKPPSPVSRSR
jgi:hypothetical protein